VEVVASLSQGRTAAAQCGLFTYKSVPVIFEPPCSKIYGNCRYCIPVPDNTLSYINVLVDLGPCQINNFFFAYDPV